MDWREDYKQKLTAPEEAVKIVKSGDRVAVGGSIDEPEVLPAALWDRRDELNDMKIYQLCPMKDYGWGQPGAEGKFEVEVIGFIGPISRGRANEHRISLIPNGWYFSAKADERAKEKKDIDVFLVRVSPPNDRGFFCFGSELWLKKDWAAKAKRVIVEVDKNIPWVYGDGWIHVTQVHGIVEHDMPVMTDEDLRARVANIEPPEKKEKILTFCLDLLPHQRQLLLGFFEMMDVNGIDSFAETIGLIVPKGQEKIMEAVAGYVNELMKDGDCFQIGQGSPSGFLPRFGAFAGKSDLGYHAEMTARGVCTMVKDGQITGKYKNINKGKAVFNSFAGMSPLEAVYASDNPLFEVYSASYVTDPKVIAMNDNMVAINNGLSVDLTGQINSEVIFGGVLVNGPGGQPDSQLGAIMSKGGRGITVMRSAVMGGTISSIVAQFEPGTVATVGRHYADYIVTEYGIARLMNKNFRDRANELIAVAHPDFRADLKKEAQRLFWP
ncbi:MAG: acetyl-CoA hydrolase/transferase family protein [Deltaproteobacteria bacterium]|nr:acetyl-CoA hydrolase/transferase family protein [Deltaproteobacteria bacterium]